MTVLEVSSDKENKQKSQESSKSKEENISDRKFR